MFKMFYISPDRVSTAELDIMFSDLIECDLRLTKFGYLDNAFYTCGRSLCS
jgi:hypothetical protein